MQSGPITRIFDILDLYKGVYRDKPDAFRARSGSGWICYSAADYIHYCNAISRGLLELGVGRGTRIATLLVNSPEWNFFDMGMLQIGVVQVPLYPTISEEHLAYILQDSAAEYVIISNPEIYYQVRKVLQASPTVKGIFSITKIRGVRHWGEILNMGETGSCPEVIEKMTASILPSDLATIIYTSGTTGIPKGVMLSHRNLVFNFTACASTINLGRDDRVLSFLPLCHVYERMLNYIYQYFGMSVFYAETLDRIPQYLIEVQPQVFAAVPRMIEKMYNRIVTRGRSLKEPARTIFFWALRQGHKFDFKPGRSKLFYAKLWLANRLVFPRWRQALGGHIKLIVSGGAYLHPLLARVFWAAGIPILEGYGLTETSPVIAVSTFGPQGVKFGCVGPILPGVEVKIDEDGEILTRGPHVMMGYLNRPERTAGVIDVEGWFHTGDIGELVDGKYLRITDRKKEVFKTSTGRYIAPQVIEQRIRESPFIEYIMVIGENRKYTAALIVPNFEYLSEWCKVKRIPYESAKKVIQNPKVIKRIKEEVDNFNQTLGHTEQIKKFRLLADRWSTGTGELSPTLKLRRKFILEKYKRIIEQTYRSKGSDNFKV